MDFMQIYFELARESGLNPKVLNIDNDECIVVFEYEIIHKGANNKETAGCVRVIHHHDRIMFVMQVFTFPEDMSEDKINLIITYFSNVSVGKLITYTYDTKTRNLFLQAPIVLGMSDDPGNARYKFSRIHTSIDAELGELPYHLQQISSKSQ